MLVVELEQEALLLGQQVLVEKFLVAHLLDEPAEVHLFFQALLAIPFYLLQTRDLLVQAVAEDLLVAGVDFVTVSLPGADLLNDGIFLN